MTIIKSCLLSLVLTVFIPAFMFAQIEFEEHTIAGNFDGATGVYAIDLDSDGDLDVLGASEIGNDITWWENDGEQDFTEHVINGNFIDAKAVFAIDVDGDDDIDMLGGGQTGNIISWFENDGDEDFDQHDLSTTFTGCRYVHAADLDSDDDIDILGAARSHNVVYWWENDGDEDFIQRTISDFSLGAYCVYAEDIDDDDDVDALVVALNSSRISWFENDGEEVFTERIITSSFDGAVQAVAADLDLDGDIDVLGAAFGDSTIAWWENDGNENFTMHVIIGDFVSARYAYPVDFDNDGDMDILGCAHDIDAVRWFENDGEMNFDEHVISEDFTWSITVIGRDVDSDGDVDVLVADHWADEIAWFESNLAPETELNEPDDESVIEELPLTLAWTTENVPEPGGDLSYQVQWSMDEDFEEYEFADTGDDTFLVLEDLENYSQYWWRVQTSDANTGIIVMSPQTWSFEILIPQAPDTFTLIEPEEGAVFVLPDVTLSWSTAYDPDPDDEVVYDVYLSTDREHLDDPLETNITDTTLILELFDQEIYYWTIHARDTNTEGIWADDTSSFTVELPDPPSHFSLLEPENGDTLTADESNEVMMTWQNSVDPDSGDVVVYELYLMAILADDTLGQVSITDLADTVYTVDIPDEFGLETWADYLLVHWYVKAISGRYNVECDERFTINIEPNVAVESNPSTTIPLEYSIESMYPNPFNSTLSITIALPAESELQISIFNIIGQNVAVFANGTYPAGFRRFTFDGIDQPSGIYFIHAEVPGKINDVRKVVLIR
ncbi:MAG: FG-GAP-like repeat-containing protein [Candidatus Electryonea clarkiae]|nr:FG-GAP-like repeat-containing protein [Candidatus Electryonea clarkiae]MDP8287805.1 FG-GAP-like repeat-containing protein [Candidatus Electryonea clarkiae]